MERITGTGLGRDISVFNEWSLFAPELASLTVMLASEEVDGRDRNEFVSSRGAPGDAEVATARRGRSGAASGTDDVDAERSSQVREAVCGRRGNVAAGRAPV